MQNEFLNTLLDNLQVSLNHIAPPLQQRQSVGYDRSQNELKFLMQNIEHLPIEQKQQAQILFLSHRYIQQNKFTVEECDIKQFLNNFAQAQDQRCQQVLKLLQYVYNMLLLLEQIKLVNFEETKYSTDKTRLVTIDTAINMIQMTNDQIIHKVYHSKSRAQEINRQQMAKGFEKEFMDKHMRINDENQLQSSAEEGYMHLEQQASRQIKERISQIDTSNYEVEIQQCNQSSKFNNKQRQAESIEEEKYNPNHLKNELNESYSSFQNNSNNEQMKERVEHRQIQHQPNHNLEIRQRKYLDNPDLPPNSKPISFYIVLLRKMQQQGKFMLTLKYGQNMHNLQRDQKSSRVGQEEFYVCNKEDNLKLENGKAQKAHATVKNDPGPFFIQNL
eukprot:403344483